MDATQIKTAPEKTVANRTPHALNDKIVTLADPTAISRKDWRFTMPLTIRVWAVNEPTGELMGWHPEHGVCIGKIANAVEV